MGAISVETHRQDLVKPFNVAPPIFPFTQLSLTFSHVLNRVPCFLADLTFSLSLFLSLSFFLFIDHVLFGSRSLPKPSSDVWEV